MSLDTRRLREIVRPLSGGPVDFDPIVAKARTSQYVLIGEATHGTHEFYRIRAEITKRLLTECGFAAVAVEGDWPDAYRVHRFVRGIAEVEDADEALGGFRRFPTWMWRNADVLDFVGWLRAFNEERPIAQRVGFFGLDLYSLYASIEAVISYLDAMDPEAAARARDRYACFEQFGEDVERYAHAVGLGLSPPCRNEALEQLLEMQRRALARVADGATGDERRFIAEQNAFVVAGAEEYYRRMLDAEVSSWNLRDRFMHRTLERLRDHLSRLSGEPARVVVWAHNSHVGDARATSMGAGREFNIGQLARESQPSATCLVGFSTSEGSVTAASQWHGEAERKRVRPPAPGSWEAAFHDMDIDRFMVDIESARREYPDFKNATLLQRAIGVLYLPQSELRSHYMQACLGEQFDFLLHYDLTRAVEPLERTERWVSGEVPETFPTGV